MTSEDVFEITSAIEDEEKRVPLYTVGEVVN